MYVPFTQHSAVHSDLFLSMTPAGPGTCVPSRGLAVQPKDSVCKGSLPWGLRNFIQTDKWPALPGQEAPSLFKDLNNERWQGAPMNMS